MKTMIQVVNMKGIPFNVVIVEVGDSYGRNNGLLNTDSPLVEFYDARYNFDGYGQFISRYYASTLSEHEDGYGLCLYGGVPDWNISPENMREVKRLIKLFA